MPRTALRVCVLLVAAGFLFAWVPDVDLGDGWLGGSAVSAPESGPQARADDSGCRARAIDDTADPSTDITAFRAAGSSNGLLMVATFHDLQPRVQQDVEFDIRTSQGRDLTVAVARTRDAEVLVTIGEPPPPVEAAAAAEQCSTGVTMAEPDDCAGLVGRLDARADRVTVEVPGLCLGNPRWARAGVSAARYVSPSRIPHDVWLPPGGNRRADFGPLGPWVSLAP
jgi:hypothetical protein